MTKVSIARARVVRNDFVIWAYPFDAQSGGSIALLALCERLNELGYSAALWPADKPPTFSPRRWAAYFLKRLYRFQAGPFRPRFASRADLKSAVVVYPEIVPGNPLRALHVARWLLHRAGFHDAAVRFGERDSLFAYNTAFADVPLLTITYHLPEYRQTNFGHREGSCVLVRKGKDRPRGQHPADAEIVDDLSHAERAATFNRCRFLYCYDPYTYFANYAAICGCIPIIIPQDGVGEDQWQPDVRWRAGMAYGENRIEWAISTRDGLLANLAGQRAYEDDLVRSFAAATLGRAWLL